MKRILVAAVAGLCATGCYLGSSSTTTTAHPSRRTSGAPATPDGGRTTALVDASASGLPCGLVALLDRYCVSCHSSPPAPGVIGSLATYDDLVATAKSDPSKMVAELALSRIRDGSMPPPPTTSPPASDVASLASWIAEGMPRDACTMPIDAGASIPNPYDTPLQCTSGSTWAGGDSESPNMHPGGACIGCHSTGEGPRFAIAGTVFPTAHEPYDCNGSNGTTEGIVITITDSTGNVVNLNANGVGNFYYRGALSPPYHAKITAAGRERAMSAAQASGDCNSCHTTTGMSGAPGRIMAP